MKKFLMKIWSSQPILFIILFSDLIFTIISHEYLRGMISDLCYVLGITIGFMLLCHLTALNPMNGRGDGHN